MLRAPYGLFPDSYAVAGANLAVLAVRTGVKEHQFCRFSRQQSSLFLEAGHTSWLAAEDNAQSSRVEFSPYDFGQAKR